MPQTLKDRTMLSFTMPSALCRRFYRRRTAPSSPLGLAFFGMTVATLLALAWATPSIAQEKTYTVYVVPQFTASEISEVWKPVLTKLSERIGVKLNLKISRSIPEFEQVFLRGEPDIAFVNPYHAIMAKKAQGYEPIVYDKSTKLTGILVVKTDSPIQSLKELDGAEMAFPSPNAFGASLYMRALLQEKEKIKVLPRYVTTHSNVYRQVANGGVVAGGGVRQTLDKEDSALKDHLRVIYETPPTRPHPVVVHPRVPAEVRRALQQAFVELGKTDAGRALLKPTQINDPVAASYADYVELDRLELQKYEGKAPQ